MEFTKAKTAFATLGLALVTGAFAYGALNKSPENVAQKLEAVQTCVADIKTSLDDIAELHKQSIKQSKTFHQLKLNVGESEAIALADDPNSTITDGIKTQARARVAEKTLLRGVGNLDVEPGNPVYEEHLITLCESSKVRENLKEARTLLTDTTDPKSSLPKYKS